MDWLGIGVFILAIAFSILVAFLIPVLKRITNTLDKSTETIEKSTQGIEEITKETTTLLQTTNDTLVDVNGKLSKLDPVFQVIHDAGESAQNMTSSLAKITANKSEEMNAVAEAFDKNKLDGLVRGAAFIYYLFQAKKNKK